MHQRPASNKAMGRSTMPSQAMQASALKSSMAGSKKKIEGYDNGQMRSDTQSRMKQSGMAPGTRAANIGNNFSQNLDRLKNQGTKQVEDEYIKTLQEEIKILEYQMKILKDKEIEQQAAVSQIDKFFSDGVPLNDNILALKTQYQSKKSEEEKFMDILKLRIVGMDKTALDLDNEIKHYSENRSNIDKEKLKIEGDLQKIIDE